MRRFTTSVIQDNTTYVQYAQTRRKRRVDNNLYSGYHCIWLTYIFRDETVAQSGCGNIDIVRLLHTKSDRPTHPQI